ncbi:alpha/beta fold hydrolase [Candidatus Roizmanbacteria bacterium]|nr:alpha/beta fold hydrolase [Candidatus Roizmanbacteria bacterium]
MDLIKTKSFELAVNTKGNQDSNKLAIALPGRLDTKDYINFSSHLEYLANRGFFSISFDPPGTWESPGGIEMFTTTNYLKAVSELIEYFGNKPTLLLGHSLGGTVSILAGTSYPAVKALVVIMAAYGSSLTSGREAIRNGVKTSYRDLPPGNFKTNKRKKFALPTNYFKDGEQYDSVAALKSCSRPKLLFYGTRDVFTTPEKVMEVYDSIPEPKMIHKLDSDHDYRYHPGIINEINEAIGQFVERYLIT